MPSLRLFRYAFTPPWWACAITLLAMILFISLGQWQLLRADEKRALLLAEATFAKRPPITWGANASLPKPQEKLRVNGHFLPAVLLLDNQHDGHQFGYHVLSPLELDDNHVIIIDRGFTPANPSRNQLPIIQTPTHTLSLIGRAYYPSKKQWVLGSPLEIKEPQLAMIELIDIPLLSHFLHKSVYPFIIRLTEDTPYSYKRSWVTVSMPPERHEAYAFQWFAIALTILVLFIALNSSKT